jgi:hypothetical protein
MAAATTAAPEAAAAGVPATAAAVTTAAEVAVAPTRSTRVVAVADPDMLTRVRMPAAAKDAQLPSDAPDPFLNRQKFAAALVNMVQPGK